MTRPFAVLFVGAAALVATMGALGVVVPLFRKHGIIDEPNHRSSHVVPTVRGAGLASAVGLLAAGFAVAALRELDARLTLIIVTGLLAATLGLIEDLRGLTTNSRLIVQLGIGLGFAASVVRIGGAPWWVVPFITLGMMGYINAANFMDGVDSISAFHGMVAGLYFTVLGGMSNERALTLAGVMMFAVFAGFAPWNLARNGGVFLGDVGSYLLGALVASCAGVALVTGAGWLPALAPMLPYLADTTVTVTRRAQRRECLTEPHRSHIYQRLAIQGWSHLAIGATVAAASLLCCAIGILAYPVVIGQRVALLLAVGVVIVYVMLPRLSARVDTRRTVA